MSEYDPKGKYIWKLGELIIEYPDDCEEVDWDNLEEETLPEETSQAIIKQTP